MYVKQPQDYLSELSRCVRCGGCKVSCPTFEDEPIEAFGARGRLVLLRKFLNAEIGPTELLNDRIFSCMLCGACSGSCPLGIDITDAIYHGRARLKRADSKRRYLRSLLKISSRWPELAFKIARLSQSVLFPVLDRKGLIPFAPELPESPFKSADQVHKVAKKRGRVAVFAGCSTNYIFPNLGDSLVHVLQKLRYEVVLPKGEVCCGTPLRSLGLEKEAREQAKRNLRVFGRLKVEAILSLCPTCTATIRDEYPKMVGDGLERAQDISVFLADKLDKTDRIGKSAVYHDPCHLKYGLGVEKEPRYIIQQSGVELRKPEDQGCCGFGGLFCLSFKDISDRILEKRAAKITAAKSDLVVTSCPACILQLSRKIADRPVLHLIELIEDAYCFRQEKTVKEEVQKEPTLF